MKFFILFGLCFQIILTIPHSKSSRKSLKTEKTAFEDLSDGPIYEIMNHLDQNSKEQLSKTSKEFFRFDPRDVVLSLPLRKSKEPSQFICEHLNNRKKLVVVFKGNFKEVGPNSKDMKYLKCLSGIDSLTLITKNVKSLSGSKFKSEDFFPKLQHLKIISDNRIPLNFIPNNIKSLKLLYGFYSKSKGRIQNLNMKLKEKISQLQHLELLDLSFTEFVNNYRLTPFTSMVSELNDLPNFKRLTIEYAGYSYSLREVLAQIKNAKYALDLNLYGHCGLGQFNDMLPKNTETLTLNQFELKNNEKFCSQISNLSRLKKLNMELLGNDKRYDCLLHYLPSSLTEMSFSGIIQSPDTNGIIIPKSLQSISLREVNSIAFEVLANHVSEIKATISDPENFMKIEKSFTKVTDLIITNPYFTRELNFWIHLLDLLPMEMSRVQLNAYLYDDYDFSPLEEKILALKKRIKQLVFSPNPWSKERKFIFDGSKMVRRE